MHSKGHYKDKIRKTYKIERDGLHTAIIFQKEYTYQVFICNDTVSKKIS